MLSPLTPPRRLRRRRLAAALRAAAATTAALSTALFACALALTPASPVRAQHTGADMQNEHDAMLALVPTAQATHTAVASGNWSAGSTWSGGTIPGAGSRVYVPAGRTVTYDVNSSVGVSWLRVNGKIAFNRSVTTALTVDTIVVDVGGEWEQGTPGSPIAANVSSTVTFSDGGAINTSVDTFFQSRGMLCHGKARICGATVTPFARTTTGLAAGATSLGLNASPVGWKVGDRVLVTGMRMIDVQNPSTGFFDPTPTDEVRNVGSVSGSSVGLASGLTHSRTVEFGSFGLYPRVANLNRNVVFRSANATEPSRKGHVMFMHTLDVDVRYAQFENLGRTRKDIDVTNGAVNTSPPGSNPRGRYAFHFHRGGKDNATITPAYVQGCVVVSPTSWGYVNHDSYVVFEDNVCYNAFGSGFITENGAELGAFRRNLASVVRGRGFIKDGVATHDLARSGVAFWFQGGNLTVEDNVATGASSGYSYFQRSGVDLGDSKRILRANLIDPDAAGGNDYVDAADTPIMRFKGNTAIACYQGIFNVDTEINGIWPTASLIEDYTDLNSKGSHGARFEYYRNFTFKNVRMLRDSTMPPSSQYGGAWAISGNHLVDHLYPWETRSTDRHEGIYVRGYWNAIDNDDGDLGVSAGSPERIAKHEVIDNSVDFVGPGVTFANTGTLLGMPLVIYTNSTDVPSRPQFSPPADKYTTAQSVTISADPGATIYYARGPNGYQNPSVESRLRSGQWTLYTGPVTVGTSSGEKLIAISYRNGKYSRIRNGVFRIDPNAGGTQPVIAPTFSPAAGTYTGAQSVSINTATSGASIRYTTDGSNPSSTVGTLYSAPVSIAASTTLKAIAYKSGMTNSSVTTGTYTINAGTGGANNGTGLRGEYFNNKTLTAPVALTRTDATVNFNWGTGGPGSGIGTDNFSVRWEGEVEAPVSGTFTFYTNSDDGVRLWVNGQQLVNNWTDHGPTENSSTISLSSGQKYAIRMEYYESGGGAVAQLSWAWPGQTKQVIPQTRLYPATGGGSGGGGATTVTLNPTDDRNTQNDSAAGTNAVIACSQWNTIYVKFDMASVTGTVTSAKLRIYKVPATSGMGMTAKSVASDNWTQATAPASLPAVGSTLASITAPDAAGYVEFDVTPAVQGQMGGDRIISIALNTSLGSWTDFQTREGTNKPQLVITRQ